MNAQKENTLVRALGLFTATLLVAGIMIGSGVFKKIIPIAQTGLTEGWILLAWVLAGVITMLGALNLAGLSSLTEESGGVYEYLRLSFGNFFSFLFGFCIPPCLSTPSTLLFSVFYFSIFLPFCPLTIFSC